MKRIRIIARLDVKAPNLIKGVQLEGLRVVGDPYTYAVKYFDQGIDELLYMDSVASLYQRNMLFDLIEKTTANVFIPITVGGGIRTVEDVHQALLAGADKVAINTAVIRNPEFISCVANRFGSQCMTVSIEAKRKSAGYWEALVDNGREKTGKEVIAWAKEAVERGAGEILLTSIDQEGTRKGFDFELIREVSQKVSVPVIASGGMGALSHLSQALDLGLADAVAIADAFHFDRFNIGAVKQTVEKLGYWVRPS